MHDEGNGHAPTSGREGESGPHNRARPRLGAACERARRCGLNRRITEGPLRQEPRVGRFRGGPRRRGHGARCGSGWGGLRAPIVGSRARRSCVPDAELENGSGVSRSRQSRSQSGCMAGGRHSVVRLPTAALLGGVLGRSNNLQRSNGSWSKQDASALFTTATVFRSLAS